ncbi:MAG: DVUA0089 family protein [Gammaproteobacteria bacterium]
MSKLKSRACVASALVAAAGLALPLSAAAANLSFTGTFSRDDDVQLFTFNTSTESTITLRTWSYAGGINSAGAAIPEGGFDPILTLFDASGAFIAENDDDSDFGGECGNVATSVVTGECFDTYFETTVEPGTYTVSIQQYDYFSVGNLSDGFANREEYADDNGPILRPTGAFFTSLFGCSNGQFCDADGYNRSNAWAFDILNVDTAAVVPLPASIWFLATGLAGLGWARKGWRLRQSA